MACFPSTSQVLQQHINGPVLADLLPHPLLGVLIGAFSSPLGKLVYTFPVQTFPCLQGKGASPLPSQSCLIIQEASDWSLLL